MTRNRNSTSLSFSINQPISPEALLLHFRDHANNVPKLIQRFEFNVQFLTLSSQFNNAFNLGPQLWVFRLLPRGANLDSDEARERLLQEMVDQALEGPTTRLSIKDIKKLAERELPPGNWSGVFLLYQAHCLATKQPASSRALFYEVSKPWRGVLKFRGRSQHSVCQMCDKLRARMRHSKSFVESARATDALLGHLALVWRCRETYWHARQENRSKNGLLTIIIDGYDRSKPALPRWGRGQQPKHSVFERVPRPCVLMSAAIAHGFGVVVFFSEEHGGSGGSYTWECLLYLINKVWKHCRQSGQAFSRSPLDLGDDKLRCFCFTGP